MRKLLDLLYAFLFLQAVHKVTIQFTKITLALILEWKPIGMIIRGRPRKRWIVDIEEDMQIMGIRWWRKQCEERAEWKRITEKAKIHSGL